MALTAHQGEILHCLEDPSLDNSDAWEYFEKGLLLIEDGYIVNCGAEDHLSGQLPQDVPVIKHEHALILPGFIDTHIHYPQTEVIASYGTRLIEWLEQYTFPAEMAFADPEKCRSMAEFFIRELLRNGTTSAMVFATVHPQSVDAFFEEANRLNTRMVCGKVMMDRNAPEGLTDTVLSGYERSRDLIKKWHGKGRLGYAVTPRFAITSTAEQLASAGRLLSEFPGVHFQTHLAENPEECDLVSEFFPNCQDYLDVYDRYSLLGRRSVFAHGIHLCDREWQRLRETDSSVAYCPASNLFIGSGMFDLEKADLHGVRVGMGTDVAGGDSFSMLRTINQAYKVQQLQQYNLSPLRSVYMSTLGGARALDLDRYIGNFETGKEADFIVLDYAPTDLVRLRLQSTSSVMERLFVLQMLGDDRAIRETWVMGNKAYAKDARQTVV
ncbi:MAG: guanine deaminase [Gammaproteobacteria bacterium]|nr:guanine deaminase [Gammaproteobacteria bacterium]